MTQVQLIEKQIQQISNILLLNGTLTECSGLIHGKIGIAVFFFHYARHTGNVLYEDYALDLINETQSQIHNNSSVDYETGLAGIGTGIGYLIKHHFLSADEDIFEDMDKLMYRAVMNDPSLDFSLYGGLTGYGRYWIMRLNQSTSVVIARKCLLHIVACINEKLLNIPTKEQLDVYCFLHDLFKILNNNISPNLLEHCRKWSLQFSDDFQRFPRFDNSVVGVFGRIYQKKYFTQIQYIYYETILNQLLKLDFEKTPNNFGLLTGYAGEAMLRLTALNKINISWMCLL